MTTRRMFFGTTIMALPAPALPAKGKAPAVYDRSDSSDPVFDALADEFTRITADGARKGFSGEHFRHYAGFHAGI